MVREAARRQARKAGRAASPRARRRAGQSLTTPLVCRSLCRGASGLVVGERCEGGSPLVTQRATSASNQAKHMRSLWLAQRHTEGAAKRERSGSGSETEEQLAAA